MVCFLFLVVFNNSFTSLVDNENVILRLALVIPTGVPITVASDKIKVLYSLIPFLYSQPRNSLGFH